jgi:hypothetical protein
MADGFKRKRADFGVPFTIDVVREPDDDPYNGTGLLATGIDIRIVRMEDAVEIINENVDTVVTQNPLQVRWAAAVTELDIAAGHYGISLLIRGGENPGGEERFPVNGFIPLELTENHENLPT